VSSLPPEELGRLYRLVPWAEDPYSEDGRQRYEEALRSMRVLVKHEWIQELLSSRRELRLLELCGGTGIGGVALARVLADEGVKASLTVIDLRREALEIAAKWGGEELGEEVRVVEADACRVHELGVRANLALMYGYSAPHFDPWRMAMLLSSTTEVLVDDGILVLEESDRRYTIFYLQGYKAVITWPPRREGIVAEFDAGYDFKRGTFKRVLMNLPQGEFVVGDFYYWGLAELMTLAWLFFKDVDFTPLRRRYAGFILARKPRRKLRFQDLAGEPRVLEKAPKPLEASRMAGEVEGLRAGASW